MSPDCFISRLITANAEQGKPAPYLVAIALDEQIVDTIPMEPHDRYVCICLENLCFFDCCMLTTVLRGLVSVCRALDAVITPSAVYFRETGSS